MSQVAFKLILAAILSIAALQIAGGQEKTPAGQTATVTPKGGPEAAFPADKYKIAADLYWRVYAKHIRCVILHVDQYLALKTEPISIILASCSLEEAQSWLDDQSENLKYKMRPIAALPQFDRDVGVTLSEAYVQPVIVYTHKELSCLVKSFKVPDINTTLHTIQIFSYDDQI